MNMRAHILAHFAAEERKAAEEHAAESTKREAIRKLRFSFDEWAAQVLWGMLSERRKIIAEFQLKAEISEKVILVPDGLSKRQLRTDVIFEVYYKKETGELPNQLLFRIDENQSESPLEVVENGSTQNWYSFPPSVEQLTYQIDDFLKRIFPV